MNPMTPSRRVGLTLIELLVTIVIVAILASIALPTYQAQVRKSKRTAAAAFLMDVATREHQRLLDVRAYADFATLGMTTPADIANQYSVNAVANNAVSPPTFVVT